MANTGWVSNDLQKNWPFSWGLSDFWNSFLLSLFYDIIALVYYYSCNILPQSRWLKQCKFIILHCVGQKSGLGHTRLKSTCCQCCMHSFLEALDRICSFAFPYFFRLITFNVSWPFTFIFKASNDELSSPHSTSVFPLPLVDPYWQHWIHLHN